MDMSKRQTVAKQNIRVSYHSKVTLLATHADTNNNTLYSVRTLLIKVSRILGT